MSAQKSLNITKLSDFGKICRTCLSEGKLQRLYECNSEKDILTEKSDDSIKECLVEKLMSFTFLQFYEADGLPELVCAECIKAINFSFSFAKKCEESDFILRDFLNNYVVKNKPKTQVKKTENNEKTQGLSEFYENKTPKNRLIQKQIQNETCIENAVKIEIETETDQEVKMFKAKSNDNFNKELPNVPKNSQIVEENKPELQNGNISDLSKPLNFNNERFGVDKEHNYSNHLNYQRVIIVSDLATKKVVRKKACAKKKIVRKVKKNNVKQDVNNSEDKDNEQKVKKQCAKKFSCPICKKTYSSNKSVKHHLPSHSGERPYVCHVCGQQFSFKENMNRHMKIHTGERPHQCQFCGKGFIQSTSLREHLRTHSSETPFICNFCGKAFKQTAQFKMHLKKHTSENSEPGENKKEEYKHTCNICDRRYKNRSGIRQHLRTHGEKNFLCSYCGRGFVSSTLLQSHIKVHTGVKPYKCTVCEKAFSQKGSLDSHYLLHTGEKPFVCNICNKAFSQRPHLKYHIRMHNGERPYCCTVCKKSFTSRGTLKVHSRIHTGEKPYACNVCGKAFYDSSSMKKHQRCHANGEHSIDDKEKCYPVALTTSNLYGI